MSRVIKHLKSAVRSGSAAALALLLSIGPVAASDQAETLRLEANAAFTLELERASKVSDPKEADRIVVNAVERRAEKLKALRRADIGDALTATASPPEFVYSDSEKESIVRFLAANKTPWGLPLSYRPPRGYWRSIGSRPDNVEHIMERLLTGEEGFADAGAVNLYDAATWQIAMALSGRFDESDAHTERLASGRSGQLQDIRAWGEPFLYGEREAPIGRANAFFFRMISDSYSMRDPLDNKEAFEGFPTTPALHHEDWKPIAGENSWAAIIGPLQSAWLKYDGSVPWDAQELKLALSILPAVDAMQSSIGAIYHVPKGAHGKHPRDISNENNISMYAALKMLRSVLRAHPDKPEAAGFLDRIERILEGTSRGKKVRRGMEDYFEDYLYDPDEKVFHQGGFWIGERFYPSGDFAVDVQTWGLAALGAGWINREVGRGDEGFAYRLWQATKERAGYFQDGVLRGVGFTAGHDVLSSEWTFGAILMAKELARYYERLHEATGEQRYLVWTRELRGEAASMREGIESLKVRFEDGSSAYKYANRRYYIVFGWWANPVPTLTSAWAVMLDGPDPHVYFNPFFLGGRAA